MLEERGTAREETEYSKLDRRANKKRVTSWREDRQELDCLIGERKAGISIVES